MRIPLIIHKYINYEYWPMWLFYLPLWPYWIFLSIRARTLFFFTAANPGIPLGGFKGESKKDILGKIDPMYLPKSIFVKKEDSIEEIFSKLTSKIISFPFIVKPDMGLRGKGIEKINDPEELINYHSLVSGNYIVQEYLEGLEFGIFYVRDPISTNGLITSITSKEFLSVTGDGTLSILELMKFKLRARFQIKRLKTERDGVMKKIPALNEQIVLETIGNHCRGTRFINSNHLLNEKVHKVFDQISIPIEGFFYGRFDIKVKQTDDLYSGENIKIMELNGAVSEPAHIYDRETMNLFTAYRDLLFHWRMLYQISIQNMRRGHKPASMKVVLSALLQK